jgi:multidrug efflux pump subunit AcrA (membrane-fusion protein)
VPESIGPPSSGEDATRAFLGGDPPHWAARGLAFLLIGLAVIAAIAAAVIRLPETVTGPFTLGPVQGADPIRAARSGTVVAVRLVEGQPIERGDPTFTIRSSAVGDRSAELRTLEARLSEIGEGRRNAREKYASQRRNDDEEVRRLERRAAHLAQKIAEHRAIRTVKQDRFRADLEIQHNTIDITLKESGFKRTQYALARELAERFERYHNEGAISWLDFKTRELEMTKLAVEAQQLERTLETEHLRANQLRTEHETWEKEWRLAAADLAAEEREVRTALEKQRQAAAMRDAEYRDVERRLREEESAARIRVGALRDDLAGSRGGELSLQAPCSGTVLRLSVKGPGAVVQEGELLADLVCSGERLHAEMLVDQAGIALIRPGHKVKLLYEAFPFQRYGVKFGTVRWISPGSVVVKDRPVFRVFVDLHDASVAVGAERRPLLPGMGGTAEVVTGTRSLLSFVVEPLRRLKENLTVPAP